MWWQRENSFHLRKVQVRNMTNPAGPWNSAFQTPALQGNKLLLVKSSNKKQVGQDPKSWARGDFKLIITYLDQWTYGSGFWKRNIFFNTEKFRVTSLILSLKELLKNISKDSTSEAGQENTTFLLRMVDDRQLHLEIKRRGCYDFDISWVLNAGLSTKFLPNSALSPAPQCRRSPVRNTEDCRCYVCQAKLSVEWPVNSMRSAQPICHSSVWLVPESSALPGTNEYRKWIFL